MAKNKAKFKMSPKAKKWLIGTGIVLMTAAFVGIGMKLNKLDKTKEVSATFGYEQGILGEDGGEVKGTTSIRTKDFITVDGLKCDLTEDPSITYKLFWYDEEETFISASTALTLDFDAEKDSVPENAEYVRILITPTNDPEVSGSEISKYAGELTVEYAK